MIAYKFLAADARAPFSRCSWPLPAGGPGAWVDADAGPLDPCRNGVHACAPVDLPYWIAAELWQVELAGEQMAGPQSLVARRGRLLRRVDAWNADNAHAFAEHCRARAEAFVTELPHRHGAAATAELLDCGAQYLATVRACLDAGNHAVCSFAAAMAFTVLAPSPAAAFSAERAAQGEWLRERLGL